MSVVDAVVDALLRLAARRWPAGMREEQMREWVAEVHVLRHQSPRGGSVGRLAALRYALSLACSPPVEDEHGIPRGWREALPGWWYACRPLAALAGSALFCTVMIAALPGLAVTAARWQRTDADRGDRVDWLAQSLTVAGVVLAVAVAALAGGWLGRRLPVAWAHRTRLGVAGSAVLAPAAVASGVAAVHASQVIARGSAAWPVPDAVPALLLWTVLVTPLAYYACRGRRELVVSAVGALIVLDLAAMVMGLRPALEVDLNVATGPLWFPLTWLDSPGSIAFGPDDTGMAASDAVVRSIELPMRSLLASTAFAMAYGIRASRATVPAPPAVQAQRQATVLRPPYPALVTIGAALVIWVYGLSMVTPDLENPRFLARGLGDELHLWTQEIRLGAILLAILALVSALANRGPTLLPATLTMIALVAADTLLDAADAGGWRVFASTLALGAGLTATAWWSCHKLASHPPQAVSSRRNLGGAALLAAFCAPAMLVHHTEPETAARTPVAIPIATAALAILFAALAGGCAVAARRRRPPRYTAMALTCLPVLPAIAGILTGTEYAALLAPPLVVLTLAIMRWQRPTSPLRAAIRWTAFTVGAALAAVPLLYTQLIAGVLVGEALIRTAGYEQPADGLPYLPGALAAGLPIAAALTTRSAPRHAPPPDPILAAAQGRTGRLNASRAITSQ